MFPTLKTKGTVYTNSLKSLLDRFRLDFRIFPSFCGILSTAELCHHPPDRGRNNRASVVLAAPLHGLQQQTPPPLHISLLEARNYREWRLPVSHFRALPSPCLEQEFRSQDPTSPAEPMKGRVYALPRPVLAGTQLRFCVEIKISWGKKP